MIIKKINITDNNNNNQQQQKNKQQEPERSNKKNQYGVEMITWRERE